MEPRWEGLSAAVTLRIPTPPRERCWDLSSKDSKDDEEHEDAYCFACSIDLKVLNGKYHASGFQNERPRYTNELSATLYWEESWRVSLPGEVASWCFQATSSDWRPPVGDWQPHDSHRQATGSLTKLYRYG